MTYEVYYHDFDTKVSYDYEADWTGDEDIVVVFKGTLEECKKYTSTHTDPDGDELGIMDSDGFAID